MSVQTTRARLAAMYALVTGVTKAFPDIPRAVQDAELPAVVIWPGEATYDTDGMGDNEVLETRIYQGIVLVQNVQLGTENQGQIVLDPFIDRIADYFLGRPGLELTGASPPQVVVDEAKVPRDSGHIIQNYGGVDYHAVIFYHEIKEVRVVTYQDGG